MATNIAGRLSKLVGWLALVALSIGPANAITPAAKLDAQAKADALVQQSLSLKAAIDALPLDAVPVPPVVAWPRLAPDVLDVDLASQDTLLNAKFLDGNAGWDGNGTALHYGFMAGAFPINNGVGDYSAKLSNPTCPPRWGVEPNGLHYLETCTDGTKEPCRSIGVRRAG
jgi:hypothetical protein